MKKCLQILSPLFLFLFATIHADLSNFHICTVATKKTAGLDQLVNSCQQKQIEIDILGMGKPYHGHGHKLLYVQKYLENIPDDHIVLFVDGYDTFLLADKETILNKFLEKKVPCIFSAEYSLFRRAEYPKSPTKFQALNSGSYIGYANCLKQLLLALSPIKVRSDDQNMIRPYFLAHQDEIVLDYYCDLFFPLNNIRPKEIRVDLEKKVIHCVITKTAPCVIHGNGWGRKFYQQLYDALFLGKIDLAKPPFPIQK